LWGGQQRRNQQIRVRYGSGKSEERGDIGGGGGGGGGGWGVGGGGGGGGAGVESPELNRGGREVFRKGKQSVKRGKDEHGLGLISKNSFSG